MPVSLIRGIWETAKQTADEAARVVQEKKGQEGLRALRAELDRVGVSTDDFLKRYYAPKATPDYLTRYRIPPPGVGAAPSLAARPITAAPTPTPDVIARQAVPAAQTFEQRRMEALRKPIAQRTSEDERLIAATSAQEFEQFTQAPGLGQLGEAVRGGIERGVGAAAVPYEKIRAFLTQEFEPARQLTLALASPGFTTEEKQAILKATSETALGGLLTSDEGKRRLAEVEPIEPEGRMENFLSAVHSLAIEEGSMIVDPLNFIPVLGFTRVDDVLRVLGKLARLNKPGAATMLERVRTLAAEGRLKLAEEAGAARIPGKGRGVPKVGEEMRLSDPEIGDYTRKVARVEPISDPRFTHTIHFEGGSQMGWPSNVALRPGESQEVVQAAFLAESRARLAEQGRQVGVPTEAARIPGVPEKPPPIEPPPPTEAMQPLAPPQHRSLPAT